MTHAKRTILLPLVLAIVLWALAPAAAFASVYAFATAPPIAGGGGGTGELYPWGWGVVTHTNGAAWGDDALDTKLMFTPRSTTWITAGPQEFLGYVDKNPNNVYLGMLKLTKSGTIDVPMNISTGVRNSLGYLTYQSADGTLFSTSTSAQGWFFGCAVDTLDPGTHYSLRFLRGIKANNSVTGVIYTDALGHELGYIANTGTLTYPDEGAQYIAKQFDTFRFRNCYTGTYEDFEFQFQTYADVTAFNTALANAQASLATAMANEGYGPGQVDPARVATLSLAITAANAISPEDRAKQLQPAVDTTVSDLNAAAAGVLVLNAPAAPVTTIHGVPSGWASGTVVFSLEASGVAPVTSAYALGDGPLLAYVGPVDVKGEGLTVISYFSTDGLGQTEATETAVVRIDTLAPVTSISGVSNGSYYPVSVAFSLLTADAGSGVDRTFYAVDGGAETVYAGSPVSVAGEGSHIVAYRSVDSAGNAESVRTVAFTISVGAPATHALGVPSSWSTLPVTFSLAATGTAPPLTTYYSLGGGAVGPYSVPVIVTAEGATPLAYYSVDGLGHSESTQTATILIDSTPPVSSIAGIADGGVYTSGPVQFSLVATDAVSGVAATRFSLDGGSSSTYSSPVSVSGIAAHTVTWWSTDAAGNVEGARHATFRIVAGPPVTSSWGIPSSWSIAPVTFSLAATGDVPPFTTYYSIGGAPAVPYVTPVTISAEGTTSVTYYSTDASGQTEVTRAEIVRIDSGKPATTLGGIPSGGLASGPATFTLSATDAVSGVAPGAIRYVLDGAANPVPYTVPVSVSATGTHTIVYWSKDIAGNREDEHTARFTISAGAAVSRISALPSGWSTAPVTFSLETSGDAGPFTTIYALDGAPLGLYSGPVTVSREGTTAVTYGSVDSLGQTETVKTAVIRVDSIAPATSISGVANGVVYPSGSKNLTLVATDAASGIAVTRYALDGGDTNTYSAPVSVSGAATHTLTWRSTDVAGNVEQTRTATFRISGGAPVTSATGVPPGWSSDPVTLTLAVTGDTPAFTTYYSFNGGASVQYTAPVMVDVEGTTTVRFRSADAAGQVESTRTVTIRIDGTAPTTTSDAVASYVTSATVHLTATDGSGSGVVLTRYSLDGAATTEGDVVSVTGLGSHTLEFSSVDAAGHVEARKTAVFVINAPAPTATSISIRSTASTTFIGRVPILSGNVMPADLVGRIIVVYVQKPGSARWSYSSNRVVYVLAGKPAWQYKYTFKRGMTKGLYRFKASVPASSGLASSFSSVLGIRLR